MRPTTALNRMCWRHFVEVASAWRRLAAAGALDSRRAQLALQDLASLRVSRVSHTSLLSRCWELRASLTTYEAAYVAVAELDLVRVPFVIVLVHVFGGHAVLASLLTLVALFLARYTLADRLVYLLTDPPGARAMGEKGMAWVDQEWRWDLVARRLQEILAG